MHVLRIPLTIRGPLPSFRPLILCQSICLPLGRIREAGKAVLLHQDKAIAEAELTPLVYWPDGSLQWCRVVSVLSVALPSLGQLHLEIPGRDHSVPGSPTITRNMHASGIDITTGSAEFRLDARNSSPIRHVRLGIDGASACSGFRVSCSGLDGSSKLAHVEEFRIDTEALLHTRLQWRFRFAEIPKVQVSVDMVFFAGTGLLDATVTIRNESRARHTDGLWDLGDKGSILLRDFSIEIDCLPDPNATVLMRLEEDSVLPQFPGQDFMLHQASSGGKNWNSQNHVNANGEVPCRYRGYKLESGPLVNTGDRASPTLVRTSSAGMVALSIPRFWQNFPKTLQLRDNTLRIGLFPHEFGDPFELQGGEQKTHEFRLLFAPHTCSVESVAVQVRDPYIAVQLPAEWVCDHGLARDGTRIGVRERPRLDALIKEALEGARGIYSNREEVDEYGWRHFGETVADHERAYYEGPRPLVSHYNNQFDVIYGFLLNYLRTGDHRLLTLADELACHVSDIDIYHATDDRAAYNGGLFWHTDHYRHAHSATHRAYSQKNKQAGRGYGGGPSCEHNFTTGLYLHHCLTGSTVSKAAVLSLADWVLRMDDGTKTRFRVLDSSPTGLATLTASEGYHGPGRGAGNSINALLDAWWLSRSEHYLRSAERLVRRCIHPDDNIEELDLLNIELRWSYTVFLASLCKYLATKTISEELDENYEYARRSLVHYARWMLEYERPYFDQEEKMQYPTETWAAQDLRKANVLRAASRYVEDPLKSTFFAKGDAITQRAWSDLERFETRACARPLAIMMVEALKETDNPPMTFELPEHLRLLHFARTEPFVAQKERIGRMLRSPTAALAGAAHALRYLLHRSRS